MKKRIVATLLATLLTAATMTGCGNNYTVALTDTNPVKVELGTELSTDVRDYITVTDGETTVENGEVFEEINLDITNVDVNAVGTYTVVITYEKNQLVIPVIVEDTTAPTIEAEDLALAEGTEVTVAEYVTVTDAQNVVIMFILADGTKTDKFTYDGTETEVTVTAEDAEGNVAEKAMKITLLDTVAPVIVAEDITIKVNDDIDLMDGISATDNVDGDVTDKVAVTGTVDTTKEGTYKVTYKVADAAGNEAVAERTVTVEKKAAPKKSNTTAATTNTNAGTTGTTTTGGNTGTTVTPTTPAPTPVPETPTPAPTPETPAAPEPAPTTPTPAPTPTTPNIPQHVDDIVIGDHVQEVINNGGTLGDVYDNADWDNYIEG